MPKTHFLSIETSLCWLDSSMCESQQPHCCSYRIVSPKVDTFLNWFLFASPTCPPIAVNEKAVPGRWRWSGSLAIMLSCWSKLAPKAIPIIPEINMKKTYAVNVVEYFFNAIRRLYWLSFTFSDDGLLSLFFPSMLKFGWTFRLFTASSWLSNFDNPVIKNVGHFSRTDWFPTDWRVRRWRCWWCCAFMWWFITVLFKCKLKFEHNSFLCCKVP